MKKYKDISKEEARKICKEAKGQCLKCPLRREHKERRTLLFCTYILINMYEDDDSEYAKRQIKQLLEEEVQYYNE